MKYHKVTKDTLNSYLSDQTVRNGWKIRDWEAEKIIDSVWNIPMRPLEFRALVKSLFTTEQLHYIYDETRIQCEKKTKLLGLHLYSRYKVDKQAVKEYLFDHPYGLTQEEIEKLTEHLPLGKMSKKKFIKYMIFGNHFLQYVTNGILMDQCRC
ncbi:uncharacterized protein LOC126837394 [Adelges cooleyi]|uniref:uncharacterized protein LOC126837394 n=1 Tax=Adelges cooleyi TaxID=133065 RepID=UPI0021802C39|nr:uncharacterized protein LOC126837394 [Adelges cooleyi]